MLAGTKYDLDSLAITTRPPKPVTHSVTYTNLETVTKGLSKGQGGVNIYSAVDC